LLCVILWNFAANTNPDNTMTEKAYNKYVNDYADNIYRYLLKNLRQPEDARDLVQTTFEKLWINRDKVVPETIKSYLFTIAYHLMIDHTRKLKRIDYRENVPENSRTDNQQPDAKRLLDEALSKLNDIQRSLVLLKDYEGYSYVEIAQITGLNESQVKVYLHRARLQLKAYIVNPENVI
jgi:RNA polymerase sigma-70 factor (ECF subfamily)